MTVPSPFHAMGELCLLQRAPGWASWTDLGRRGRVGVAWARGGGVGGLGGLGGRARENA